jgi:rhodanese-related sulfurtransferase
MLLHCSFLIFDRVRKTMRNYTKFTVILITLAGLHATAWGDVKSREEISSEAKSKVPHVSVEQLSSDIAAENAFTLLDIRTEAEFAAGHIQGAKWLPRGKLEFAIQELIDQPDARILLYCGSGARSALAVLSLQDVGYTNVADLDGGFKAWVADGQSVYNMHGELKVVDYKKEE